MIQGEPYNVFNNVPFTCYDGIKGSKLHLVNTMAEWKAFHEELMKQPMVTVDTETNSKVWYLKPSRIVGMSFGWGINNFYIPVRHEDSEVGGKQPDQLRMEDLHTDLQAFFSKEDVWSVWHNQNFDHHFFENDGFEIKNKCHDTRVLWQLYDENATGKLKLIASGWKDRMGFVHEGIVDPTANADSKAVSEFRAAEARARRKVFSDLSIKTAALMACEPQYQGMTKAQIKKHVKDVVLADHKYAKVSVEDVHYGYVPILAMTKYAALDTFLTWEVFHYTMKKIKWNKEMLALYQNERQLARVLKDTETGGIAVDIPFLEVLGTKLDSEARDLQKTLLTEFGDINVNSTDQLVAALQAKGIVFTEETDSGKFALDKKVMGKLKDENPVIDKLIEYKETLKLKDTYVTGIQSKLVGDNILHCHFNQNVSTGRMSGTDPNLMNIPAKNKIIRNAFIPPSDEYEYFFADYSQVEICLTAHCSLDPLLLDAILTGQDVHTRTMCEMFGYNYIESNKIIKENKELDKADQHPMYAMLDDYRTITKRTNFGIIYGVGGPGLADQITRPDRYKHLTHRQWVAQCEDFIDLYLNTYIGVRKWINSTKRLIKEHEVVYTEFGRPRHLPHANIYKKTRDYSKRWMEEKAGRQGVNFLIQSFAADIFKFAAVRIYNILKGTKSRLVNFVHDEVQFYLHKDDRHLLPAIKHAMIDFDFVVPLSVDFSSSKTSWADKKGIKVVV